MRRSTGHRRRPPRALLALALISSAALVSCGDDAGGASAQGGGTAQPGATAKPDGKVCRQPVRESLDPNSAQHIIDATSVRYQTDPPTSGPHLFTPPPRGLLARALSPAEQVTILEQGDVVIQYRDPAALTALTPLAAVQVTVAPNPQLPAAVVATAWTYKLTCTGVDIAALRSFVAAHVQGPVQ